jgi:hypothetical protein
MDPRDSHAPRMSGIRHAPKVGFWRYCAGVSEMSTMISAEISSSAA